ncbi:MAG: Gfo/Idh/MocA family oxidoreductase [Deltaproteobacteria bacterium]|nr:Gfo/Idh/MocA family oxidoreductase [Deltaproteobacteria bacterium]
MSGEALRVGVLGAARIAPMALLRPARQVPGVEVSAVAARDVDKARRFARKHGIPRVFESYDALLADPDVDAVYVPLPNGLHADWTIRAIEAGKHVLCEKPFTANAGEAERVAKAARASDRVVMEAFHWRYHPLAERMIEIVSSGRLGRIRRIETNMCVPLPLPGDIRYRLDLAGGATMDTGCYAIHILRHLAEEEPVEVTSAKALLSSPRVDRAMDAEVRFADGRVGRIACSLFSAKILKMSARVVGDAGQLDVFNPVAPQVYHRLKLHTAAGTEVERLTRDPTYLFQLRAFEAAVRDGAPFPTGVDDAVANMRLVDAIYEKSGLGPRG